MPEHYTRNTVSATAWCPKCQKQTPHRGGEVKLGPCLPCCERLDRERELRQEREPGGYVFEERCALREFDGSMLRAEAERLTVLEMAGEREEEQGEMEFQEER